MMEEKSGANRGEGGREECKEKREDLQKETETEGRKGRKN